MCLRFCVSVFWFCFCTNALTPSKFPPFKFAGILASFVEGKEPKDYIFRDKIADDSGDVHYGTVNAELKKGIISAVSQGIEAWEKTQKREDDMKGNPCVLGGDTKPLYQSIEKTGKKALSCEDVVRQLHKWMSICTLAKAVYPERNFVEPNDVYIFFKKRKITGKNGLGVNTWETQAKALYVAQRSNERKPEAKPHSLPFSPLVHPPQADTEMDHDDNDIEDLTRASNVADDDGVSGGGQAKLGKQKVTREELRPKVASLKRCDMLNAWLRLHESMDLSDTATTDQDQLAIQNFLRVASVHVRNNEYFFEPKQSQLLVSMLDAETLIKKRLGKENTANSSAGDKRPSNQKAGENSKRHAQSEESKSPPAKTTEDNNPFVSPSPTHKQYYSSEESKADNDRNFHAMLNNLKKNK